MFSIKTFWRLIKDYSNNNCGLSETPDFSGDNPVLKHDPLDLLGLVSRDDAVDHGNAPNRVGHIEIFPR